VVSALAARAIASGSCVVAVGRDSWRAVPRLFSSSPPPGGSVYSRVPLLHLLASADGPFLLVGLPCHARGARSLAALPTFRGRVGLVVGLFCSRAFDHEGLWALLRGRGADPSRVERMAIKRGTLVASGPGTVEVGVRELAPAALPCFERCDDFAARFSDVSVGSVDSPDGWSTVIARTEAGREALQACIDGGLVEGVPLAELPTTTRLAEAKARHAADKRQGQPSP
jgi:coenzyme F420 hydrogenase subunit beta